jgi:TRAP-type C4-dicarboxylate transport system substrate-binding protein
MMASANRMATLPANVQKVIRDESVRAVQKDMWDANIAEQTAAWNELAGRVKANATPDIDSFRSKMGPVLTDFVAKTGPKGKALVDATVAAAKG